MQRSNPHSGDTASLALVGRPTGGCWRDVAGRVDMGSVSAVRDEALALLSRSFPAADWSLLSVAFGDLEALYRGHYPGYHGCELGYHDLDHVLLVSLAAARLIDGYQRDASPGLRLEAEDALATMLVTLFHDSGYIRRIADRRRRDGAQYTAIHVTRSGQFLKRYFADHGLAHRALEAARLVQFTGYERDISQLRFADRRVQQMGYLVGTADLLGQMADCCYIDKCRDGLYPEFVLGGLARYVDEAGNEVVRYRDGIDLLRKTPGFMDDALSNRLGRAFEHCYRHAATHFGGDNLYIRALHANRHRLLKALDSEGEAQLHERFCAGCSPPPQAPS